MNYKIKNVHSAELFPFGCPNKLGKANTYTYTYQKTT